MIIRLLLYKKISVCSTAVDRLPHNQEARGSNPACRCGAFFLLLQSSVMCSYFRFLAEVLHYWFPLNILSSLKQNKLDTDGISKMITIRYLQLALWWKTESSVSSWWWWWSFLLLGSSWGELVFLEGFNRSCHWHLKARGAGGQVIRPATYRARGSIPSLSKCFNSPRV